MHTVIINRKSSDGGSYQTILKRRFDSAAIREYVDPNDFCLYQTETTIWDCTGYREFGNHNIEPLITSNSFDIPSRPIDRSTRETPEQRADLENSNYGQILREEHKAIS